MKAAKGPFLWAVTKRWLTLSAVYPPSLNLAEHLRKFKKKQYLYNSYYVSFCQFKAAIDGRLDKLKVTFSGQVNCVPR